MDEEKIRARLLCGVSALSFLYGTLDTFVSALTFLVG